ncbi:MAG: hypothetical protein A3B74_00905 [Candidatus Kerfeldbacteria bacterium RIFCSPHIGHO2_02_FULL_42_14]|uniref:Uncharacterized protein n=1 Tax=Candidatus Kerfeldbacteria bacterium RIFCSPHIGHO2_02_FULL_42_14 TaxID=1798540 RepID=A0A1G2AR47_9BACT|nr:MAG: hypothetical protein A3B74_00905 [Candidatus Kerfeldbacteria bacterium RIFCSPHIGHO2_02_FULL_42_14]OGY81912.1 MAG: hypothetical protein A3E60_00985 [Candidatus Kerfeldbacteria bacterium RIFCSPHIGHO2_12_FULL_42_13]OGY83453.1 MAG: hypothetical protein A3I91_02270 [Candidatus Kerfeldbacteria bacterium RIFCSPLOWO2_02_FULL_42_19]OGY87021.1 MAG: hypothetical protein A3G01_01940 [Candidatus Kerfeldbacteria bacterium RIFCSPLOWO2_12_FULL_43_9]
MSIVIEAVFLFIFAAVMAAVEIEIEGKNGWESQLPTWYRTTGTAARIYGKLMNHKPLTGYHLFMTILTMMIFHIGFFLPPHPKWSATNECQILARYFVWSTLWDFLWFVLNPAFGVKNFKPWKIWWHAKSPWIFDLFPADYASAWLIAFLLTAAPAVTTNFAPFMRLSIVLGILIVLTAVLIPFAKYYHRWRQNMRKNDDRNKISALTRPDVA